MKKATLFLAALFIATNIFCQNTTWPAWRGSNSDGVAPSGNPPTSWSETSNVKWVVDLPGKGHSTPVIWGNTIFVTSAADGEKQTPSSQVNSPLQFVIMAFDKNSGKELWKKVLAEEKPAEGSTHNDNSWASNSPVTDGQHVYAYFGSRGLYCLDMQGNLVWSRNFGQMETRFNFGEGSSPALYKDKIAVQWDDQADSKIIVVDANTGKDVWVKKRDEPTSWTSPIIVEYAGKAQLITAGTNKIISYDLSNGDIIWQANGLTENVIPHPAYGDGAVYLLSGYRGNSVVAVDLSKAKGNIEGTDAIMWKLSKNAPYVPSPALYDGKLYYLFGNTGKLTCADAKTGEIYYEGQDLPNMGSAYPSPVVAAGNIYFLGSTGTCHVVKSGTNFQITSTNKLDDNFSASPVVSGNAIFLRGFNKLYCISR